MKCNHTLSHLTGRIFHDFFEGKKLKFESVAGIVFVAMQELLYKCGVTWPTLAPVLLYCSNAAVPRCCQGDDFAAMLLPWFCFGFWSVVAMQLLLSSLWFLAACVVFFSVLVLLSRPSLTCV